MGRRVLDLASDYTLYIPNALLRLLPAQKDASPPHFCSFSYGQGLSYWRQFWTVTWKHRLAIGFWEGASSSGKGHEVESPGFYFLSKTQIETRARKLGNEANITELPPLIRSCRLSLCLLPGEKVCLCLPCCQSNMPPPVRPKTFSTNALLLCQAV